MIDTARVQWFGIMWSDQFADWLHSEYPTAEFHTRFYDRGKNNVMSMVPWQGATVQDDVLGTIQVKSNRLGNWLVAERSMPKFLHGDNCRVLSVAEAEEALTGWVAAIEGRFRDWFMEGINHASCRKVTRLDLCHQQKVPNSSEVFAAVAAALNARKVVKHQYILNPMQVHLTGVVYHQSKLEHARWYDKGLESGNEKYIDVVRHEEQYRRGKAGYFVDLTGDKAVLDVQQARDAMNRRYDGWGGSVEAYSLGTLLDDHKVHGAAAMTLVLHPEYEPVYRQHLSNGSFYRLRNLAMDWRRHQMSIDLRLPEDAWREPMVL